MVELMAASYIEREILKSVVKTYIYQSSTLDGNGAKTRIGCIEWMYQSFNPLFSFVVCICLTMP